MVAESAEGNGDLFAARQTQQANRRVAKRSQIVRAVTLFDLALVFAKRYVSHPVQTVFDAPVSSPMGEQKRGVSPLAGQATDGVLGFDGGLTLGAGRAFQPADLGQAGPIEMPGQPRTGLKMPLNDAAVPRALGAGLRERRLSLTFRSGGKNRAGSPRPPQLSARADCP